MPIKRTRTHMKVFANVSMANLDLLVNEWLLEQQQRASDKYKGFYHNPHIRIDEIQTLLLPKRSNYCHHIIYWFIDGIDSVK